MILSFRAICEAGLPVVPEVVPATVAPVVPAAVAPVVPAAVAPAAVVPAAVAPAAVVPAHSSPTFSHSASITVGQDFASLIASMSETALRIPASLSATWWEQGRLPVGPVQGLTPALPRARTNTQHTRRK